MLFTLFINTGARQAGRPRLAARAPRRLPLRPARRRAQQIFIISIIIAVSAFTFWFPDHRRSGPTVAPTN